MRNINPLQYGIDEGMIFIAVWPDKDEFGSVNGKIWSWHDCVKLVGDYIKVDGDDIVSYQIDEYFYEFYGKQFPSEEAAMEAGGAWLLELNAIDAAFQREMKKLA